MQRFKNFVSTGLATNGRLYAGDLNLMQDLAAAQSDFGQTHDVATLRVGDGSLQLTKFGTGEGRFTGSLRVDGILRGLGGLIAGTFTTPQRDAMASGAAPYGTLILNTTKNSYEWNKGTDTTRSWQPVGVGSIPGELKMWSGSSLPDPLSYGNWVWADGAVYSSTTYPQAAVNIHPNWKTFGGLGDPGAGFFRVPDLRGSTPVGMDAMPGGARRNRMTRGNAATIASPSGEEFHTLSQGEMPTHGHTGRVAETFFDFSGNATPHYGSSGGGPGHTVGIIVDPAGGNGAHENIQPSVFVPFIVRLD